LQTSLCFADCTLSPEKKLRCLIEQLVSILHGCSTQLDTPAARALIFSTHTRQQRCDSCSEQGERGSTKQVEADRTLFIIFVIVGTPARPGTCASTFR
jgi:hypothetical protein